MTVAVSSGTGVIEDTCVVIDTLNEQSRSEQEYRYARRNKIRYIDDLLNEFEMLNLSEEAHPPIELMGKVRSLIVAEEHPICARPAQQVPICDWMEALYDVQDSLMLPAEDDDVD